MMVMCSKALWLATSGIPEKVQAMINDHSVDRIQWTNWLLCSPMLEVVLSSFPIVTTDAPQHQNIAQTQLESLVFFLHHGTSCS